MISRVCIFCGSSSGSRREYVQAARAVGAALALRGLGVVYGGGRVGLMGLVADSALEAGAEVIGIIPESLFNRELAHPGVTDLRVVGSMHERKALMADLSDGFLALPEGFGTFEEFCEVLTWAQLGLHRKPCGLLNVAGYYDPLLRLFDFATAEQFVHPDHRSLVMVEDNIERMLDAMAGYSPPALANWITRDEI